MKQKIRLNPEEFDLGRTEQFYSGMAQKGWRLTRRGMYFSSFEEAQPEEVKYRIEVVSPKLLVGDTLPEEQIGIYEDCGWEYVTGRGFLHIFRAPAGSDAPEFYLEPEQQAQTIKGLRRKYILDSLSPLFYLLLFSLLSFLFWNPAQGYWTSAFYLSWIADTGVVIGWPLVLAGLILSDIRGTVYLSRIYHRMKKGIPFDHKPAGRQSIFRISQAVILTAGILCIGGDILANQTDPLPQKTDDPYLLLTEAGISGERTPNYLYHDQESEVRHKRTFLSESWNTREFQQDQQWLFQKVYHLRSPQAAERLAESLMHDAVFAKSPDSFRKINVPGLDYAWTSGPSECVVVKDCYAAALTHIWDSTEDMADTLTVLAGKWEKTP